MYKIEGFYRKKGGARELLAKEKKELFLDQDIFLKSREGRDFLCADCFFFLWGQGSGLGGAGWIERAHVTDYLIGANQKILNWLIKITFLGKSITAIVRY